MCGLDNYQGDDMQSMCPSKKGQQNDFFIILQKSQFGDLPKLTTKCLKFISNHSMVVSGTYYNPFQGLSECHQGVIRVSSECQLELV